MEVSSMASQVSPGTPSPETGSNLPEMEGKNGNGSGSGSGSGNNGNDSDNGNGTQGSLPDDVDSRGGQRQKEE
ncbi:MAG: hypothetical protein M1819_002815 [Sarea resinae]|nr:MAG: hypothetical protein M1819_002815 [Sarea resinae]